jgi:transcriptional antiterminator RfaH
MSNFNEGWYLIYTRPQQERKVANRLLRTGIQTYLPLTRQQRKRSDRIKILHAVLFPSYLFVYLKNIQEYFEGINADGACYYVKSGSQAAKIHGDVINYIRMLENSGENLEVTDMVFKTGQQLVIQQGPLSGLSCEVIQYKGKERILVRVAILQRNILADLQYTSFVKCV